LIVVGPLFAVVAVVYFTRTAGALPVALPGHVAGSAHKHIKHGVAAPAVAVVCWIGAWFSSGHRATLPSHLRSSDLQESA
jgi:hypothetical protein